MTQEDYYLQKIQRYNHDKNLTHESDMTVLIEREEMNLVSILKPKIFIDGKQWCVLYGENLQNGVAGFGDTPRKAVFDFNKSWDKQLEKKYCMPDNVNTKEEHDQYLKDIGVK